MDEWVETYYGPVKATVLARAQAIKLLICDVDGVLSNGLIYMDSQENELKTFHVHDGHGISQLLAAAFEVALITCRSSRMVSQRAAALGIGHVYQGERDKTIPFQKLLLELQLGAQQVAYIGDDWVDWPVMSQVGLSVCVADAHPGLLPRAHYVTGKAGGRGAVRELCDLLLLAQNKLQGTQCEVGRVRSIITAILALIACSLFAWHWTGRIQLTQQVITNDHRATYQMQRIVTTLYEATGQLSYQLAAERAQHYSHKNSSHFEQPHMILFDANGTAIWVAQAQQAELATQRLLYLKGDVEVHAVAADALLQRLQTQQAQIDLVDQSIVLEQRVTVYGLRGVTIANKARGNIKQQQFTFTDGVDSYYDMAQ